MQQSGVSARISAYCLCMIPSKRATEHATVEGGRECFRNENMIIVTCGDKQIRPIDLVDSCHGVSRSHGSLHRFKSGDGRTFSFVGYMHVHTRPPACVPSLTHLCMYALIIRSKYATPFHDYFLFRPHATLVGVNARKKKDSVSTHHEAYVLMSRNGQSGRNGE